jgi:hypothetical protein
MLSKIKQQAGPSGLLAAAMLGCVVLGAIAWDAYGAESLLPAFVTGFAGTLLAFILALRFEGDRERRRAAVAEVELRARRETEVRRRFEPIRAELEKNAKSLDELRGLDTPPPSGFELRNPQLLEGAWIANAPRLSELIADYELIADLATAYGWIEELRWRIRYRTEHASARLDGMTAPLVEELRAEVADLIERVKEQVAVPDVQPLGLLHRAKLSGSITPTGTLSLEVIRGPGRENEQSR